MFAILYLTVAIFGERAFQQDTYQFTPAVQVFYLLFDCLSYVCWGYITVRIGGTRSVKYLLFFAILLVAFSVFSIFLEPVTIHERKGQIDWLSLPELYSPGPITDWGGLITLPLGLFFGVKLVKPEQLEFEKVKIDSNSNYPRDDYHN